MPRVKLPKTFLAVNLSEAFTFEDQERLAHDCDMLEMKALPSQDVLSAAAGEGLVERGGARADDAPEQHETADAP